MMKVGSLQFHLRISVIGRDMGKLLFAAYKMGKTCQLNMFPFLGTKLIFQFTKKCTPKSLVLHNYHSNYKIKLYHYAPQWGWFTKAAKVVHSK